MKLTAIVISCALGTVAFAVLEAFAAHALSPAKRIPTKGSGRKAWEAKFGTSDRRLAQGDLDGALESLRPVEASPNVLVAGEATRRVAEILQRQGHPREAYDEYARLVDMARKGDYANSSVSDGLIHARMAILALDMKDRARFERTLSDLSRQMKGTVAQIGAESARRRLRGTEDAQRFAAQTEEIRLAAESPPLLLMARALAKVGEILGRDRLYELALRSDRSPRILKEYGDWLDATHQPRAALRLFSEIPKPYREEDRLSIEEALRTLSSRVADAPKITESQEEREAIRKHDLLRAGRSNSR